MRILQTWLCTVLFQVPIGFLSTNLQGQNYPSFVHKQKLDVSLNEENVLSTYVNL